MPARAYIRLLYAYIGTDWNVNYIPMNGSDVIVQNATVAVYCAKLHAQSM